MFIHLLHTNDLHSHFESITKQSHFIHKKREDAQLKEEPFLLIDLGDHMDRVHPMSEGTEGRGNVALLNAMGYDFVTIGNNEGITFTKEALGRAYLHKQFPILLANVWEVNGDRPSWCQPTLIKDINGFLLGFVGVTAPFTTYYEGMGWTVKPPLEVLEKILPELRKQVDCVVVLSHVGAPFDQQLATELDGIDIIIGSHTHNVFPEGLYVNQTLIAQAGKFGRYAGEIILDVDDQSKQFKKQAWVHDVQNEEEDLALSSILDSYIEEGTDTLNVTVTSLENDLTVDLDQPSPLADCLAEGLREWCAADIGMINSGVLLGDLKKGPLSKGDIHRICPHPLNPCRVIVNGSDLIELIKMGENESFKKWELLGFGFRGKRLGGFVFSGLDYTWNGKTESVEEVKIKGEPLVESALYTVATSDMFTFGTVAPPISRGGDTKIYMPEFLRDVLAWKLQRNKN